MILNIYFKNIKTLYNTSNHSTFYLNDNFFLLEYYKLYCILFFSFELSLLILYLTYKLSPQLYNEEKQLRYECGFDPFTESRGGFDIHYYLVAVLFIIFDLEIIFLLPWVYAYQDYFINYTDLELDSTYLNIVTYFNETELHVMFFLDVMMDKAFLANVDNYPDLIKIMYNDYSSHKHTYLELSDITLIESHTFDFRNSIFGIFFLFLLLIGFIYEWKTSALQW